MAQIGGKLGASAATVCRDVQWVRQPWRKAAVQDFGQARVVEFAKLNLVARNYETPEIVRTEIR